jgi:hypothetical protein
MSTSRTYDEMPQHYLLRVGDGNHFNSSSAKRIWGIDSTTSAGKFFLSSAKAGDLLSFVKSKSRGLIIAVATFTEAKERVLGPLIALTPTNEELGWVKTEGDWDTEVHYKDLYNVSACCLYTEIKGASVIRTYNDKCMVNLPLEYSNIVRYSKITNSMAGCS